MEENIKIYVKYGLIILFGCLTAYAFVSGSLSAETIVELFQGLIE
jgi:hypothetical protein